MNGWEIVASFVFGLLVNEMTDVSPWAARRLVRWAAYRWTTDPDMAEVYAEEWTAIIDERPGKLFKLATALQFTGGAVGRTVPRRAAVIRTRLVASRPAMWLLPRVRLVALVFRQEITAPGFGRLFALMNGVIGTIIALVGLAWDLFGTAPASNRTMITVTGLIAAVCYAAGLILRRGALSRARQE
ncbi:hypothetical protein OG423_32170 [Micromonospora zamorensis]|uniref:hypothetical protein n=1 Tax=Micromonospora zamorensis TaxID=709883 RepID=UPI00352A21EC|nr:hypothetical protein OG423_32170 [Micromonospora zamorensis]